MCVARHAQFTQNKKSTISLQYLKKEMSDEVGFLHADNHENLLQIDFMILMWMVKHFQSSQNTLVIKVSHKMILSLLMGMIKHSQST